MSDSAADESSTDSVAPAVTTSDLVPSKQIEAEIDPVSESGPSFKCDQCSILTSVRKDWGSTRG